MPRSVLISFGCTLLIGSLAFGQPAPPASSETVTENSSRATPEGVTFTVPAGWTLTTRASMVVLDPPEPDSHVAIVDVKAKNADEAVATAWTAYMPGFKRPLKIALPLSALGTNVAISTAGLEPIGDLDAARSQRGEVAMSETKEHATLDLSDDVLKV